MGVPAFYRWLSEKYPKIVTDVLEERVALLDPTCPGGDGTAAAARAPFDCTRPNPSGLEADNLYIDMNGIIHPCSHPEHGPQPSSEQEMYDNVCRYVDRLFRAVRPRRLLYLAVDGVAPRAKMNQQRARRFRSAQEMREGRAVEERVRKALMDEGKGVPGPGPADGGASGSAQWDSNVITPGTKFMLGLSEFVRFYIRKRISTDPAWKAIRVIFSDASIPGEGEHKIMAHIRLQRSAAAANSSTTTGTGTGSAKQKHRAYNPNLVHVLHGLDADLIMLALATHESHFYVLREEVVFGRRSQEETDRRRQESGHAAAQRLLDEEAGAASMMLEENQYKPLQRLSIPVLREYLANEFRSCLRLSFVSGPSSHNHSNSNNNNSDFTTGINTDNNSAFENLIDDVVFLCFFVGNDFLPHLPSLDIRDGALDYLFNVYKRLLPSLGGYITDHGGNVNLRRVDAMLAEVGSIEDYVFEMKYRNEQDEKKRREDMKARKKFLRVDGNGNYVPPANYDAKGAAMVGVRAGKEPVDVARGRAGKILEASLKRGGMGGGGVGVGGVGGRGRGRGRGRWTKGRETTTAGNVGTGTGAGREYTLPARGGGSGGRGGGGRYGGGRGGRTLPSAGRFVGGNAGVGTGARAGGGRGSASASASGRGSFTSNQQQYQQRWAGGRGAGRGRGQSQQKKSRWGGRNDTAEGSGGDERRIRGGGCDSDNDDDDDHHHHYHHSEDNANADADVNGPKRIRGGGKPSRRAENARAANALRKSLPSSTNKKATTRAVVDRGRVGKDGGGGEEREERKKQVKDTNVRKSKSKDQQQKQQQRQRGTLGTIGSIPKKPSTKKVSTAVAATVKKEVDSDEEEMFGSDNNDDDDDDDDDEVVMEAKAEIVDEEMDGNDDDDESTETEEEDDDDDDEKKKKKKKSATTMEKKAVKKTNKKQKKKKKKKEEEEGSSRKKKRAVEIDESLFAESSDDEGGGDAVPIKAEVEEGNEDEDIDEEVSVEVTATEDEYSSSDDDDENDEAERKRRSDEATALFKEKVKAAKEQQLDEYAKNVVDNVRLHEAGWKDRYYSDKCKADDVSNHGGREHLFRCYVMGLCWVMRYYYDGVPSWKWYYPFHYAPFASDLRNIERFQGDCDSFELNEPFRPVEQLMAVLPEDSSHAVPKAARWLMGDPESPIIDFYPKEVPCDPNGKAMPWLWVVLLPFIDEERLLEALKPTMAKWTKAELLCNARGLDDGYLFVHSDHCLAPKLVEIFKAGDKFKVRKAPLSASVRRDGGGGGFLSDIVGSIRRPLSNEVYDVGTDSSSTVVIEPPASAGRIERCSHDDLFSESIDPNLSLCVAFTEPEKKPHRSVLLPGAVPPPPILRDDDFRIRRPRLNRGGGTIAHMGKTVSQSQRAGFGSMNVSTQERELAHRMGRGAQMNQTGLRPWGAMEPTPKRQRYDHQQQQQQQQQQHFGGGGVGGYGQEQQQQQYMPNPFQVQQQQAYSGAAVYSGQQPWQQQQQPGYAQNYGQAQQQQAYSFQGYNSGGIHPQQQQQQQRGTFGAPQHYSQHPTQMQTTATASFGPPPQSNQFGYASQAPSHGTNQQQQQGFSFRGFNTGGSQQQQQQHQQGGGGGSRVNPNLMNHLRSQLANTLQQNRNRR